MTDHSMALCLARLVEFGAYKYGLWKWNLIISLTCLRIICFLNYIFRELLINITVFMYPHKLAVLRTNLTFCITNVVQSQIWMENFTRTTSWFNMIKTWSKYGMKLSDWDVSGIMTMRRESPNHQLGYQILKSLSLTLEVS